MKRKPRLTQAATTMTFVVFVVGGCFMLWADWKMTIGLLLTLSALRVMKKYQPYIRGDAEEE
jgi:hypothetical protein